MERMTSDLSRLLQEQNFQSEEEAKAFMEDIVEGKKIT